MLALVQLAEEQCVLLELISRAIQRRMPLSNVLTGRTGQKSGFLSVQDAE